MQDRVSAITAAIETDGFARIAGAEMERLLAEAGFADWAGFAESWNDLGLDRYMADGGRYRRRRFSVFALSDDGVERKPHQPHYQSRDYNTLNGGIQRWFEPIRPAITSHPALTAVLRLCHAVFTPLAPEGRRQASWHAEVHQFRIEAQPGRAGKPTPEGMHRDGVDWVLVMLVRRENVSSGTTQVRDDRTGAEDEFTLSAPLDAVMMDDHRIAHAVTPIEPLEPEHPAYRDVLVVTLRREGRREERD